jgi:hypothetical protein
MRENMITKQVVESAGVLWWAVTGSNCGPPACKL